MTDGEAVDEGSFRFDNEVQDPVDAAVDGATTAVGALFPGDAGGGVPEKVIKGVQAANELDKMIGQELETDHDRLLGAITDRAADLNLGDGGEETAREL